MDIKKLKDLIKLAKSEGIIDLKYKSGEDEIAFKFPINSEVVHAPILSVKPKEVLDIADPPKSNLLEVKSPFVGTFYASPSPESPTYVKKGEMVRKGQVLCIVEAMKIMNEIESEFSGEIVEICVENENYVEYGQVLFRIKP